MEQPIVGEELNELLGLKQPKPSRPSVSDGILGLHDTLEATVQRAKQASTKPEGEWEIVDKDWLKLRTQWFEGTYNRGTGKTTMWPNWPIALLDFPTVIKDLPNLPPPPPEGPHVPPGIPIVPGEDPKILCKLGMCDVPPEEEKEQQETQQCTCGIKPDGTCKECLAKGGEIAWSIFKQLGIS